MKDARRRHPQPDMYPTWYRGRDPGPDAEEPKDSIPCEGVDGVSQSQNDPGRDRVKALSRMHIDRALCEGLGDMLNI